jgi:hypothetical protein
MRVIINGVVAGLAEHPRLAYLSQQDGTHGRGRVVSIHVTQGHRFRLHLVGCILDGIQKVLFAVHASFMLLECRSEGGKVCWPLSTGLSPRASTTNVLPQFVPSDFVPLYLLSRYWQLPP